MMYKINSIYRTRGAYYYASANGALYLFFRSKNCFSYVGKTAHRYAFLDSNRKIIIKEDIKSLYDANDYMSKYIQNIIFL